MWSDLIIPWQACFELAWEAYCDDCIPIGAIITEAGGEIISRGRNRISDKTFPGGHSHSQPLAHAEVEALHGVNYGAIDPHTCILYTTTEPCPMCMGTFYMSGLRTLQFGARDPYAGSIDILGSTWYLSHKPIKVSGPAPELELAIISMFVERELGYYSGKLPATLFWEKYANVVTEGIGLGQRLYKQGELKKMRINRIPGYEVYNRIAQQVI
jgi:tRNA(Arg) A34 adenosine deaminase TadA